MCEIETDKATMDVPATVEGTVLALLHKEGDDVPVLEPIAVIGEPGETWEDGAETAPGSAVGKAEATLLRNRRRAPARPRLRPRRPRQRDFRRQICQPPRAARDVPPMG